MSYLLTREFLGVLATVIGVAGYVLYLIGIYKHGVKPHIFSWFLWGLLMIFIWLVQFFEGAGPGAWVTIISAVCCLVIAVIAYHRGEKSITRSDWVAFILGLISIPLWYVTKQPLLAIIILTGIEAMAFFPTIRKSLVQPREESLSFFSLTTAKFFISCFAIENMILTNWLYPVAVALMNGITVAVLLRGRRCKQVAGCP